MKIIVNNNNNDDNLYCNKVNTLYNSSLLSHTIIHIHKNIKTVISIYITVLFMYYHELRTHFFKKYGF